MSKPHSREELLHLLANDQSLNEIYQTVLPQLVRYVLRNSGTSDDAKDLFQESMMIVYRKTMSEDFELTSSIETFIYSVAKRRWMYELRQRKAQEPIEAIKDEDMSNKIDEWIINEERSKLYLKHLHNLSEGCRDLMELFFRGLSMDKIARQLSLKSSGYARKKKHDCQEKLLNLIKTDPLYIELRIG